MNPEEMQKDYTGEEITIIWQPSKCIHSKICWKGLIEVFNPRKRPWVDPNAASGKTIASQIDRCPSGALSYYFSDEQRKKTE